MTPDPLKPKPETLGFEREAELIFLAIHQRYLLQKEIFFIELFASALEAAFSKGTEEGYRKGREEYTEGLCDGLAHGFDDGWNACRIEAAKLVEHWNKTMWSHDQLIEQIRALKPAKGERT